MITKFKNDNKMTYCSSIRTELMRPFELVGWLLFQSIKLFSSIIHNHSK